MNPLFLDYRKVHRGSRTEKLRIATVAGSVIFSVFSVVICIHAQYSSSDPVAEFNRLSTQLSADRLSGGNENEAQLEKALIYLDSIAIPVLNSAVEPNLEGANRGLAALASHTPPVGENYRLLKLGGPLPVYATVINFGQGGPAAVRIYAGAAGHFALAARIDHVVQKDFFDSDVELLPVSASDPVFVTVSGRTDDLSTGLFSAWRFDGQRVIALWNSDLVQQSSYEADDNALRFAYCSQVDEDRPSQCLKMSRDVYRFQGGEWTRIETVELPPAKQAAK